MLVSATPRGGRGGVLGGRRWGDQAGTARESEYSIIEKLGGALDNG